MYKYLNYTKPGPANQYETPPLLPQAGEAGRRPENKQKGRGAAEHHGGKRRMIHWTAKRGIGGEEPPGEVFGWRPSAVGAADPACFLGEKPCGIWKKGLWGKLAIGGEKSERDVQRSGVIYVAIGKRPTGGMVKDPHAAGLGPGRLPAAAAALSGRGKT